MRQIRWEEAQVEPARWRGLADSHGLSTLSARLVAAAGMDGDGAEAFLYPERADLPDPHRIPNMNEAVDRIQAALEAGERILVHGDYDVDGLMGAAILMTGLRALGGDVLPFIPSRFGGGYGVGEASVRAAEEAGASLVLTADCGTNAREAEEALRRLGMDFLVSDHHLPTADFCTATPVVNPHVEEGHPDRALCGAAVALQVMRAVTDRMGRELRLDPYLRLVAVATVADSVPMTPVNRALCRRGMETLADTPSPALRYLLNPGGIRPPVRSCHLAFALAACINAAGRMAEASLILDLLLERDRKASLHLATLLEKLNEDRKREQTAVFDDALVRYGAQGDGRVAFVAADHWHKGVLGPVAARLAETVGRSAFVMTYDGDLGTGSARAWAGENVSDFLERCSEHLVRFGGHRAAAGFTVKREKEADLRGALSRIPAGGNGEAEPQIFHGVDPMEADGIWDAWGVLDPFGPGNEEPYLGLRGLVPERIRVAKRRHMFWEAVLPSGRTLSFVWWNGAGGKTPAPEPSSSGVIVGRPVPEAPRRDMTFRFQVETVL